VELAGRVPYYGPRIGYLSRAAREVRAVASRHRIDSVIEIGAHLRPIVTGADVMDLTARTGLSGARRVLVHDARETPWPIEDRAYDLLIALQVFEHLPGHQEAAFREVRRVARNAILSLPIDWEMANTADLHHGISHEHVLSWFRPVVPSRVVLGNGGRRTRLIYVFEDLPTPTD
jgi:Methyltransferase domain